MDNLQPYRTQFDAVQSQFFNEIAEDFLAPLPEIVTERLRRIVEAASLGKSSLILDVGTGCGALIPHFLEKGIPEGNIVACDLSPRMLDLAKARFPGVRFLHASVLDVDPALAAQGRGFDAIFFNACFGNLEDQPLVLKTVASWLSPSGVIVVSHPGGAKFVEFLHGREPHIVPNLLPDAVELRRLCEFSDLKCEDFVDEESFYLARLTRS